MAEKCTEEARITRNEEDIQDLWVHMEKVKNRPPVWTTFLIAGLSSAATCAITIAVMVCLNR